VRTVGQGAYGVLGDFVHPEAVAFLLMNA